MRSVSKIMGASFAILFIAFVVISSQSHSTIGAAKKEAATNEKQEKPAAEKKAPAPKGMPVEVTTIKPETLQVWKKYSGRVVAVDRAELRPQVSGRITEIRFKDGHYVEKGDILIVIDPRPYEAALKQAEANLATAKTRETLAEKEYNRAEELVKKKAVSESLLDTRGNNYRVAKADVLAAEAMVETAKINIDYAYVKAPINGKVSRAEITVGNLVQSGTNAPLLTSIVANKEVYVDFEIDEQTYITSIRQSSDGAKTQIPVKLTINQEETEKEKQQQQGYILSFDNRIDQSTGTIRSRALFDNSKDLLLPGMTVGVEMGTPDSKNKKLIAISERAIGTDQDRKFVYIVNAESKAEYREVRIGDIIGSRRIILSGLKEDDVVITEGLVRIRPNTPVTPKDPKIKTATN